MYIYSIPPTLVCVNKTEFPYEYAKDNTAKILSLSSKFKYAKMDSVFEIKFPCVSITPLGLFVVPDV